MALSTPEMSQLLEAATRLFLFMCHSVIEESSSKALPKGTDIFVLSAAAFEAALPEAGGFELPEQLCWILSVQRWVSAAGTPSPLESLGKLFQT